MTDLPPAGLPIPAVRTRRGMVTTTMPSVSHGLDIPRTSRPFSSVVNSTLRASGLRRETWATCPNLGPRSMFSGLDPMDMFRLYDPATANLMFWGEEFNIKAIVFEVERILPKLQEEANKPPWEEAAPKPQEVSSDTSPDAATEE